MVASLLDWMSTCEGVLDNIQLMVLEYTHSGLVRRFLVKNGPVITVFVRNSHVMVNYAWNGPVMNGFVRDSHILKNCAWNGPEMNYFAKNSHVVKNYAWNGPVMM